ncbi:MAG TPA: MFS transporter [Caulobacteraceae bacterium]|jgi:ACS family D-galactonate transporter-like MFS transporter|nr:MFS transporter [Caulobacteraceae bacterium]
MAAARTRTRFVMLALISGAVAINYLDRAILGVATPGIQGEFHLSPALMGVVFSAFSWSYFAAQVPAGVLLDRFGARTIYLVAIAGWSAATLLHAFTRGLYSLIGLRLGLGLFEAPCFPANSNIVAAWFPRRERGMAIGVYTAAEYVALGFMSPLLFWIVAQHGWRSLFFLSGGLGLAFTAVWRLGYRDPEASRASKAELAFIADGGGRTAAETRPFSWSLLRELATNRQVMGLCLGQFSVYSTFVFFLTWFPTYLATERHMGWIKTGVLASLPYLAGFFGILFAGWLSDTLLRRGASLNLARKLPVIMGLLVASTIVLANYVQSTAAVVAILSVAFFAQAMSSSGWAVLSEMAPKGTLGLVGGLFSAAANLSGIVTPLAIGFIVQATGSFVGALAFVGAVAAVGAFAWIFLIGDVRPITLRADGAAP